MIHRSSHEVKRLYKSRDNRVLTGVIGGIGEYLEMDPVLLRVIWMALVVFTAGIPGVIVYLLAVLIIPEKARGKIAD